MIPGFESVVEERIKRAQNRGDFENLPGCGSPLQLTAEWHVPEDLRLAYKILKNGGCLPRELELKKKIVRTEELLAAMPDTAARYGVQKKLNYMIMQLNGARSCDARSDIPQQYVSALANRMGVVE